MTPGQSTNRGRDFRLAPLAASSRRTTSGRSSEPQRKHLPFEGCPASGRPHYFREVYWLFATQLMAEEARLYLKAGVDPAQPLRRYRVVRRIEETTDMVSLVLEPADGGELPTINPGQYVSVRRPAQRRPATPPVHRVLQRVQHPAANHRESRERRIVHGYWSIDLEVLHTTAKPPTAHVHSRSAQRPE